MKKVLLVLLVFCLLAGCNKPLPTFKVRVQDEERPLRVQVVVPEQSPLKVQLQDEPLAVAIENNQPLEVTLEQQRPLQVQLPDKPIEIVSQFNRPLPVKLDMDKLLWPSVIVAAALLLLILATLITAIAALRAANAAKKAAKALKKH